MHSRARIAVVIALAVLLGGSVGGWLRVRASLLPASGSGTGTGTGSGAEQLFTVSRGDSLAPPLSVVQLTFPPDTLKHHLLH